MSKRVGNMAVIEKEKSSICEYCLNEKETRPYGEDGKRICYECSMSTPERKVEAERQMGIRLFGLPDKNLMN